MEEVKTLQWLQSIDLLNGRCLNDSGDFEKYDEQVDKMVAIEEMVE